MFTFYHFVVQTTQEIPADCRRLNLHHLTPYTRQCCCVWTGQWRIPITELPKSKNWRRICQ